MRTRFIEMEKVICMLWLAIVAPFSVAAQNDDPRIPQHAPAPGVRSVDVKTVRYVHSKAEVKERTELQQIFDIHPEYDTIYADTTLREAKHYSRAGKIDSAYHEYDYAKHLYYTHFSDTSWTFITWHGQWYSDSTVVTGDSAHVFRRSAYALGQRTWYAEDSMYYGWYKQQGKRGAHYECCSSPADSFWDYKSGGPFAKKTIAHAGNRDTVCYLNARGRWMVKVINHYDSAGRCVKSEYFNRAVKDFDLISMWANHHVGDGTLYLSQNGDKLSMTVRRTYNAQGLLQEEAWYWRDWTTASIVKFYAYRFWD